MVWCSLADLHRVFSITEKRWATTPPPPSVPPAGILASFIRLERCQSSLVPHKDVQVSRSCLLYAGGVVNTVLNTLPVVEALPVPFGHGVSASFAICK